MTKPTPTVREFDVTTNFQIEALKPGGLSLETALQRAERNLAAFRSEFMESLVEQTEHLQKVAARAQNDPASREQLRRQCIDLSDAATTLGYGLVAFVANHLRDACEAPGTNIAYEKIVARHVKAMRLYAGEKFRRATPADVPSLAADLGDGSRGS